MNPQFENHRLLCWSTDGIQKKGYLQTGNEWALDVKLHDKKALWVSLSSSCQKVKTNVGLDVCEVWGTERHTGGTRDRNGG